MEETVYQLNDPVILVYSRDNSFRSPDCNGCIGCPVKDKFQRNEQIYGGLGECERLGVKAAPIIFHLDEYGRKIKLNQ
jgi:hypothetical protein